ncbi:HAD family hydrolase [Roseomonas nepalensis]|uniref:HAD family hydrolase n=1 Tax=Muricoccus nepalensis TaxID=1854500 RepID=A0A502G6L2_9PROT|nr:HAD hydrolase-like protein [Roseomonas nepalensis]TPG57498.1 HAD family hydrolase [Roseomonas nepalensis]
MSVPRRAVLLDLDGTLVDSRPGILGSYAAALRALGHEPDPAVDLTWVIGPPLDDVMGEVLAHYGDDRAAEAVAAYRADYNARGYLGSTPYPGIAEALAALRAEGFALHVATSKRTVPARLILEHLGLDAMLDGIHGSEPGGALDHKPELLAAVLARTGLAPEGCVMVGDRRFDIAGAQANRVRCIGVLWGFGARDELERAGADRLAGSPGELPGMAEALLDRR